MPGKENEVSSPSVLISPRIWARHTMKIVGVDVGGTFTDIIMADIETGQQFVHKVPSTPESQDLAVLRGMDELLEKHKITSDEVFLVVHGTTIATNAMLQRKGASVCLVTTSGLEDVLEIGRQNRTDIYDITADRPSPLVPRTNRIGVRERVDSSGSIVLPLNDTEIDRVVSEIRKKNPQSIAISLLFSFSNPSHERAILTKLMQSVNAYTVASSNVLPEFREFERTSTTVLEAYLGPLVLGYLNTLNQSVSLKYKNAKLNIMQSNGGTVLCSRTLGNAVGLAISGLAGGVVGGWEIAKNTGVTRALTLDMGGTSCDISAVVDRVRVRPDNEIAGLPLRIPSVDVKTIGAGGGSIAWLDAAGILHVGPQSAGAEPGPASYARGGTHPTVTDANLILGRLNPDYFIGGEIKLDRESARDALKPLANSFDFTIEETAAGIIRISTSNMVQAIREVTIERGEDPREFVLVPFGGAGPTQAVDIAESLNLQTILIPPHPGITSAYGLICADLRVDLMQSVILDVNEENEKNLKETLFSLTEDTSSRLVLQGANRDNISHEWIIDMRYRGQSHELSITIPLAEERLAETTHRLFEKEHELQFGYKLPSRELEWVTARVVARSSQSNAPKPFQTTNHMITETDHREVILPDKSNVEATVFHRNNLPINHQFEGPLIVEQLDTTSWIPPGWNVERTKSDVMWVRRSK